jgi:hypothetical protein
MPKAVVIEEVHIVAVHACLSESGGRALARLPYFVFFGFHP